MRDAGMLLAVLLLGGVMVVSFGASTWSTQQTEMPAKATAPCDAEPNTVSCQLFETYAIAVLIMGMILAACMVGAVYMAKMEGKP